MASFVEAVSTPRVAESDVTAVTVPTIADAEIDEVAVDISSSGLPFTAALGDAVIAVPVESLMTSAVLCGAYVSADDEVTVSFAALEGGAGVTGADIDFRFLVFDLTPS